MKLPKSIEAERAVLGGMLLDSSYFNVRQRIARGTLDVTYYAKGLTYCF